MFFWQEYVVQTCEKLVQVFLTRYYEPQQQIIGKETQTLDHTCKGRMRSARKATHYTTTLQQGGREESSPRH